MGKASEDQPRLTDKEVVNLFIGYLAYNGSPGLTVAAWPDESNRQSSDIDAIAGPFAIEHSSVDATPNQRRGSAWFVQVVKALEDEFDYNLPFRLVLIFPYEGIQPGSDWSRITAALRAWILNEAPKLSMGSYTTVGDIPDIPFEFRAVKRSSDRTGLLFGRFAPNDKTLPGRLRKQLDRKANKLSQYKNKGKTTILLVESDDIALMDDSRIWDGLRQAYPDGLPCGIDQVWFADTSIRDEILFTQMTVGLTR